MVFGDNAIYGKVKEVSGSNVNSVIQAVDFNRVGKTAGSKSGSWPGILFSSEVFCLVQ